MSFTPKTKFNAFSRADGRCECTRATCEHTGRCPNQINQADRLVINYRAIYSNYDNIRYEGYDFHHKTAVSANGEDTLSNCEFLCKDCHKHTETYGKGTS